MRQAAVGFSQALPKRPLQLGLAALGPGSRRGHFDSTAMDKLASQACTGKERPRHIGRAPLKDPGSFQSRALTERSRRRHRSHLSNQASNHGVPLRKGQPWPYLLRLSQIRGSRGAVQTCIELLHWSLGEIQKFSERDLLAP